MARTVRVAPASTPSAARRLHRLGLGTALFAVTLLAYSPVFRAGYVWNDSDYVTAPALQSVDGFWRIWFELGATEQYYPILHSAFWVEHVLWGDSPFGYHLLNVLLHATAACLLAAIVRRLLDSRVGVATNPSPSESGVGASLLAMADSKSPASRLLQREPIRSDGSERSRDSAAWLSAFIFALHPICVESVAWIAEQKNTLSLVFYLAAALFYLRFDSGRRPRVYLVATVFFVFALLTKSVTATLPPALLVLAWWRTGSLGWRRDVRPLLPWFALAAVMGLVSAHVERVYIGAHGSEFDLSLLQRGLLAGRIVWFYLGKLIWPAELIFIYPRWSVDPGQAWQWLYSGGVLVMLTILWWWRGRSRSPLAAALYFGGSLFPTLGFFNVYGFLFSYVADHWQYLPSLGIIVLGGVGIAEALGRISVGAGVRRAVPIMLVAGLGILSFHQTRMYADMRTFYAATLARNPEAWMAHNNLGNLLRDAGELEVARARYEAALRVRPDLEKVHLNLGNVLRDQRRLSEAMEHYRQALALKADYPDAHNSLGALLRAQGQTAEALRHLFQAVQFGPEFADAHNNLGMALRDAGRLEESIRQFERAIGLQPGMAAAHLNLALSLSLVGRNAEAAERFREARRLNPAIPDLGGR